MQLMKKIDQYQDYANKISILDAEIDRLNQENKRLDEDSRRMRLRYSDQIAIENREESFHLARVLMAVELDSLR